MYRLLSWRSGGHTRKVSDVLVKHNIKAAADDLKIAGVGTNKVRVTTRTTGLRKAVTDVLDEETVEHVVFYNAEERPFKAVLHGMGDYTAKEAAGIGANDEARRRWAEGSALLHVYVPGGKLTQLQSLRSLQKIICGFREHYPSRLPAFSHIRANCYMNPRCVKCGLGHESNQCMVVDGDSKRENLSYVICGEKGHPASYSKCSVAVAERKREEARRSKMAPRQRQADSRGKVPPYRKTSRSGGLATRAKSQPWSTAPQS